MQLKQILLDLLLIILMGSLLFCAFLGSYHLITPDEGRYIEVAREMVVSHNFITPYLDGTAFLDKPILYYWFESFLIKSFGLNEWSVRLLPVFFGILGCVLVYWAGIQLYTRRAAWLGAIVLMSSFLYFLSAHYADMDLMVAILLSGALWFFIIGIKKAGWRHNIYLWGAYVFAALAFLTKGLMGIVFPAMIIGCWILLLQRWRTLFQMRLISGLILFLLLVMPWFVLVQFQNPEFFNYFFVVQQFSRYTTADFNMHQPVYFYLIIILVGLLPWTLFLLQAIKQMIITLKQNYHQADTELYILLWPLLLFIFFTIPKSKIIGYILPVFPPLALILAIYLDRMWAVLPRSRNLKIISFIFLFLTCVISLALIVVSHIPALVNPVSVIYLSLIAIIILCGGVSTVYFSVYSQRMSLPIATMGLTSVLAGVTGIASASTLKLSSVKPLALYVRAHYSPDAVVVSYRSYYQDLPVYLQSKVYVTYDWDNTSLLLHDSWRRELGEDILYKNYRQPNLINDQQLVAMWKTRRVFIVVDNGKRPLLDKVLPGPIYVINHYDRFLLLSNHS